MHEGLVAPCLRCGAPQALVLAAPATPCTYCGLPDPLHLSARARVLAAAATIARVAAREQRALAAHADRVSSLAWMVPMLAIPCWLLFGGMGLGLVAMEMPDGASYLDFLLLHHRSAGFDGRVAAWWLLYLAVAGLASTLTTYLALLWRIRRRVEPPPSLPPLAEGAPPRCHLCGAGLHGAGVRRACPACGAANLVDDRAFHRGAADLLAQLDHLDALARERAASTEGWAERLLLATAFYPIALILALPLGLFVPATRPDLLWIPAAIALLAAPFAALLLLQRMPDAPTMARLSPGDALCVRGLSHRVHARLQLDTLRLPAGCGALFVVAPDGAAPRPPTLALYGFESEGQSQMRAFAVQPGGAPLASDEADPARLSLVRVREPSGEALCAAPAGQEPIRIFPSRAPAPGSHPRWTLTRIQLDPDDVLLVPRGAS